MSDLEREAVVARAYFEQLDITWRSRVTWDQVEGWWAYPDGTFDYFGSHGVSLKSEGERSESA